MSPMHPPGHTHQSLSSSSNHDGAASGTDVSRSLLIGRHDAVGVRIAFTLKEEVGAGQPEREEAEERSSNEAGTRDHLGLAVWTASFGFCGDCWHCEVVSEAILSESAQRTDPRASLPRRDVSREERPCRRFAPAGQFSGVNQRCRDLPCISLCPRGQMHSPCITGIINVRDSAEDCASRAAEHCCGCRGPIGSHDRYQTCCATRRRSRRCA